MSDQACNLILDDCDTILTSNASIISNITSKLMSERTMNQSLIETLQHLKSRADKVSIDRLYNQISSGGKISTNELVDKLLITEDEASSFMAHIDSNGDGSVSVEEFKSALILSSDLKTEIFSSLDTFFTQKQNTFSLETMNKICDFFSQKETQKNIQVDNVKSVIQSHCEENIYETEHLDYLEKMWLMNKVQLEIEASFANLILVLAKKLIPIVGDYSFNNELIYEYIKNKRDVYVRKQNSTGLFTKK